MRIVSLCPSNTEIVYALGLGASLVGVDRSSDFPAEVAALPKVGPDLKVDIDAILALRPDVVLSSTSVPGMEENLRGLDAAGIAHVVVDAVSITGVYESLRLVGRLFGRGDAAHRIIAQMTDRLERVGAAASQFPVRPRVFLEWWPKPVITPGRLCWTTEMIHLAGGENVFADRPVRSTPVLDDAVVVAAPDVLLTCWCGVPHDRQRPDKLKLRPGWEAIPGVVHDRVYAAQECWFGRPGPRVVEGVEWLHGVLAAWVESPCH